MTALSHLSDRADIARFEPRPSDYTSDGVVWAIAQSHLANYLLPRDCPRVAFRAAPDSTPHDLEAFLGADRVVIAIEAAWLAEVSTATLHCYAMPDQTFTLHDAAAGYWVSPAPVVPLAMSVISNLPATVTASGATLRVLPSLWPLHDAVKASSLTFSMIRMRNAAPR